MRKVIVLVAVLLCSALVASRPSWACDISFSCSDGKEVFCSTPIGQCVTQTHCGLSGDGVCCGWYDPCVQETDVYCDNCIPTN